MQKKLGYNPSQHLNTLKMKLVNEDDFHKIYTYFFDHLGENVAFMEMGKQKRDERLEQVLAAAAQDAFKSERVVMQKISFIHLRQYRFTHGGGIMNGYLSNFIYFSDIDVGMLTLAPFPPARGETKIVRFSIREVGGRPKPSPN